MNMAAMTKSRFASGPAGELVPTRRSLLERLRDLDDHASWQEFFDTYWKLIYCAAVKFGLSDSEAEEAAETSPPHSAAAGAATFLQTGSAF